MKKMVWRPERDRILVELGKIKGSLKKLWNLAKSEKLERNECLNALHEMDKSSNNIITLFGTFLVKGLVEMEPEKFIKYDRILEIFTGKNLVQFAAEVASNIEKELSHTDLPPLISKLENPQISDKEVKSSIINFCKNMDSKIIAFERIHEIDDKEELLLLAEFTSLFPTFTPNWIVAVIYLTAMEIPVKKALKKRNKELKSNFKENFQTLLSCLKEEGAGITELERSLPPSIFWEIRNKVIHEGYSPEDEELKIIRKYVTRLMEICI